MPKIRNRPNRGRQMPLWRQRALFPILCRIVFCASSQTPIIAGLAKEPRRTHRIEPFVPHLFTSPPALANVIAEPRSRRTSEMEILSGGRDLLFILILKVCWAAALAALLVRFRSFRRLVFTEKRDSDQKVMLLLFLTPPLAIGVLASARRLPILRSDARGLVPHGLDRRANRRAPRRFADQLAGVRQSRMAFESDGCERGPPCGNDSRSDAGKRGHLAFRAVSVSEHPGMAVETGSIWKKKLGDAAVVCVCRTRSRAGRTCVRWSRKTGSSRSTRAIGVTCCSSCCPP